MNHMNQNLDELADLLATFSNAHGTSGYEERVAALLQAELAPLADEVRIDGMGNVIATRTGDGPAVMVAAHMDEIGLMVCHIDNDGFLRLCPVGGWFDQTLLSQRVVIHTRGGGEAYGVVGSRPPHVMDPEDRKKVVKLKEMFVDCGAHSAAEVEEMGIEVGSTMTIDRSLRRMGKDFVTGKAFDNRAGVTMMVAAMRLLKGRPLRATVHAVGTVQEEVGLKGARTSAYGLMPDVAIATDVTIPGDHPGVSQNDVHVVTGKGPAITVLDAGGRGIIAPRPVLRWLRETAKEAEIPYQLDVGNGGTTDATAINITKTGIPCTVLSVPARYIHSPVEALSLSDLAYGAELIAAAITSAHRYF